jgi:hypothetical protein
MEVSGQHHATAALTPGRGLIMLNSVSQQVICRSPAKIMVRVISLIYIYIKCSSSLRAERGANSST